MCVTVKPVENKTKFLDIGKEMIGNFYVFCITNICRLMVRLDKIICVAAEIAYCLSLEREDKIVKRFPGKELKSEGNWMALPE